MKKLSSRKLWCAVASTALAVGALFFAPDVMENVEHFLVALSPILAYIIGQSAVDCCSAIKDKGKRQEDENIYGSTHGEKGEM